jgi:hypothetical protein
MSLLVGFRVSSRSPSMERITRRMAQTVRFGSMPEMRPIMHDTTTAIRGFARSHHLSFVGLPYSDGWS